MTEEIKLSSLTYRFKNIEIFVILLNRIFSLIASLMSVGGSTQVPDT